MSADKSALASAKTAAPFISDNVETEVATFAIGCFWIEARFGCLPGVLKTRVGYTGGKENGPTYENM